MDHNSTDTQLLERVKESDTEAFRALFERYQPIVFRHAFFQTNQIDLSHDIVQETFIRVWNHRLSLQPHLSFLAYTLRISRNLIFDFIRHQNIRERSEDGLPPHALSEIDDPAEALQLTLLQEQITTIVNNHLPSRCREIFFLSRFEGRTHEEIAHHLHLSVRTVEHQICKALKILRKKLKM